MEPGDITALEIKRSILEREVRREERKAAEAGHRLRESAAREMQARRKFEEAKARVLAKQGKNAPPRLALLSLEAGAKKLRDKRKISERLGEALQGANDRHRAQLALLASAKAREEKGKEILRALRRKELSKRETAAAEELSEAAYARRKDKIRSGERNIEQAQPEEPGSLSGFAPPYTRSCTDSTMNGAPMWGGGQEGRSDGKAFGRGGESGSRSKDGPEPNREFADRIKELLAWNEGGEAGVRVFYRSASGKALELEVTKRTDAGGVSIAIESAGAPQRALILMEKRAILEQLRKSGIEVKSFTVSVRES